MKINKKNNRIRVTNHSRREFLKLMGYAAGVSAVLPACEQPVRKIIPFLIQPEEIIPGESLHYATTCRIGNLICPVVAKTRDGRPVKIEGNELCHLTKGGTNARVQASILDLYNPGRLKNPISGENNVSWEETNSQILKLITAAGKKKIALVTRPAAGPSEKTIFEKLVQEKPNIEILEIDIFANDAVALANEFCFQKKCFRSYNFSNTNLVVGFNSDFLGTGNSAITNAKSYAARKTSGNNQIKHIHFESSPTITGAAADKRIPVNPSEELTILYELLTIIKNKPLSLSNNKYNIYEIGNQLLKNKGKSIVISGSHSVVIQKIINTINFELGNIGSTVMLNSLHVDGFTCTENLKKLYTGLKNNSYSGIIFNQVDPVDLPYNTNEINNYISSLDLSVYCGINTCEYPNPFKFILPLNHYLESWSDFTLSENYYSLCQPIIKPLFDTKQFEEVLLKWMNFEISYHKFIKNNWERVIYPPVKSEKTFLDFWNESLQNGILKPTKEEATSTFSWNEPTFNKPSKQTTVLDEETELHLFESPVVGDGSQASNPWLMELPDPISKQCWGNAALISPCFAKKNNLKNGQHIEITADDKNLEIPVLVVPGQANTTISISLGFGKRNTMLGKYGENVMQFVKVGENTLQFNRVIRCNIKPSISELALGQLHNSEENRDLSRVITLDKLSNNNYLSGNKPHETVYPRFYKKPEFPGYHWGLAVDLNKCTGCSTCVIACQAENNTPVVGKEEVISKHEMHWLRIDRYYKGTMENPEIYFQPVMCQHCDHAPCENVCPVSATSHSIEGINQMAYNRCIGTRYCANNCPYKVRRFNWYDYTNADAFKGNEKIPGRMNNTLVKMALNPDVTVRSKGVIEKCTFCIHRIIDKKNKAKLCKKPISDGEIKMACEQACPSDAIVFGDMNNLQSDISKLINSNRSYRILEEINTLPSVYYMAKIKTT